jgi:hypothetical protein
MFVMSAKILFSVKSPLGLLTEKVKSKHFFKKSVIKTLFKKKCYQKCTIFLKIIYFLPMLFFKKHFLPMLFFKKHKCYQKCTILEKCI